MKKEKHTDSTERLYKFFIYFVLIMLAITILVPVAWVFLASIKENSEFYGNPWTMPKGFYWQNFVDAWNMAKMGDYMINSVIVTALALALLLLVALPAAYCLARFQFRGSKFLNTLFMAGLFINVKRRRRVAEKNSRAGIPFEQYCSACSCLRLNCAAIYDLFAVRVFPDAGT